MGNGARHDGAGSGGDGSNGCSYKEFMACKPKEVDGKGGAIVLTRWIEKMESVMDISGCTKGQKVKYAASSLVNKALTWRNTQVQARGRVAALGMTWKNFKALMVEEFWYTDKFHELARMVPQLVTSESKRIDRLAQGIAREINPEYGLVMGRVQGQGESSHWYVTAVTVAAEFRMQQLAKKLMNLLEEINDKM
ncbi:reverse transcriptase domain-containing protein [Artemisia annua]|uniref:Reverse transcriptase domain-containing protein n=1 Tax=Artemisia annua TaxID=35608 RepID=A0A2U1MFC1_ARTAN|nr:reverse transcriptase domain-containing protein [Artemisia annua]